MSILNTSQFRKLDTDPTRSLERKVQLTLQKMKHKFEENEYKKLSVRTFTSKYLHDIARGRSNTNIKIMYLQLETSDFMTSSNAKG